MTTRTIRHALFAATLLAAAATAAGAVTPEEGVFTARFSRVSRSYAAAKASLGAEERAAVEAGLARAARTASGREFRAAGGDLDAVEAILDARAATPPPVSAKGKGKGRARDEGRRASPSDGGEGDGEEGAPPVRESSLPPVQFTLEEAFGAKAGPAGGGAAAGAGAGDDAPPPREAPELKSFDERNLDSADRRNLQILNQVLPQVERVFKRHPNPETAEAMKQTRRFIYYLKKRACGYPAEPETDAELDLFVKSRVKKVRVIEK